MHRQSLTPVISNEIISPISNSRNNNTCKKYENIACGKCTKKTEYLCKKMRGMNEEYLSNVVKYY